MNHGEVTSPSLLERAAGRDDLAWRRLADLYRPLVARWCRSGGVPPGELDDVVQEVMMAVASGLGEFRRQREGSFRTWVRGIARHKCLDHHRRRSRRPDAEGGTDALIRIHDVTSPDDGPSSEDEAGEVNWLYRRALGLVRSEFTESTWQAFWRTTVEDQPTADVAAAMGLSNVAVRIAKSRVLARLREEVGDLL